MARRDLRVEEIAANIGINIRRWIFGRNTDRRRIDYSFDMQLRATRREMEKAYRLHRRYAVNIAIASHKLLAMYSIECGVKALLMKQNVVEQSEDLPETARINHNVLEGLKLLHAPVVLFTLTSTAMETTHSRPPQQEVTPTNLHQALRYGIPVTLENESAAKITDILTWLESQINE